MPTGALKRLPGGRATGAAGGALVGAGAAVAATQAVSRIKNGRRDSSSDDKSSSEPKSSASKSSASKSSGPKSSASKSSSSEAAETSKQQSDQPEESGGEKKGVLANLFNRGGGGGGGAGGKKIKSTNIVEEIDIGAPRRLVYDQWTQFQDFPTFMKKVISVEQPSEEKLNWKAKIFWSSRTWESTIIEQ
ncbi:hypothetical protein F8566_24515, partial [Actinomadura rudentiformis]